MKCYRMLQNARITASTFSELLRENQEEGGGGGGGGGGQLPPPPDYYDVYLESPFFRFLAALHLKLFTLNLLH